MLHVVKAHAYGNDFLFVEESALGDRDASALALAVCARHTGIGADGLIAYRPRPDGAAMRLFNADGSPAEVSGNGVRCLGAILVEQGHSRTDLLIQSAGGDKRLTLLERSEQRYTFRAAMGVPSDIRAQRLQVQSASIEVVTLWMGNPQCVVLGPLIDRTTFERLGPALEHHPVFPRGTNVEFAEVEAPDRVRILIWERGVGPTLSSGTGSCAAAVAAASYGGAGRDVEVAAPGGVQRVEWRNDGVYLTGWAEIVLEGQWRG